MAPAIKRGRNGKSVADLIRDETASLPGSDGLPDDEEFNPNQTGQRIGIFGPRKSEDEIILDEMFAGVEESKGFYLRLEKEIAPNEYQFKERIDKYKHWADFVYEVSEFVRRKTRLEIERTGKALNWGSARYRITVWNANGMRDKRPAYEISVDAKEYEIDPPKFAGDGTYQGGPDVLEIMKQLQASAISPAETARQQAEAMKQGIEIAMGRQGADTQSSNQMMTMMMGMMTAMVSAMGNKQDNTPQLIAALMGNKPEPVNPTTQLAEMLSMAKNMGLMPDKTQIVQPKSTLETFRELKELGIVGQPPPPAEDAMGQIAKMSKMMEMIKDLGGSSEVERPGVLEKWAESLGPAIPQLLLGALNLMSQKSTPTAVINNPPQTAFAPQPTTPTLIQPQAPMQTQDIPPATTAADMQNPEDVDMLKLVNGFTEELNAAVISNDTGKFNYISQTLEKFLGDKAETMILSDPGIKSTLLSYVMQAETALGKRHYVDPAMATKLAAYIDGYITYVRANGDYLAKCNKCNNFGAYENKEAFVNATDKSCGHDGCTGTLQATL